MPIAVLLTSWTMRVSEPSLKTLGNVSLIVVGVIIASIGEIKFVLIGVLFQAGGIVFEAIRLVMVQQLLSGAEFKMDPLVSLYYFAPACAIMNGIIALFIEVPKMSLGEVEKVGYLTLLANAMIAFALNISVVFLVSPHPSAQNPPPSLSPGSRLAFSLKRLTLLPPGADRQNFLPRHDPLRRAQRYPPRRRLDADLPRPGLPAASLWLLYRPLRPDLLQTRRRKTQRLHRTDAAHVGRFRRATPSSEAGDGVWDGARGGVCHFGGRFGRGGHSGAV